LSDDDQIIVELAYPPDGIGLEPSILAWWASFNRWQRWVDADFPGAT
jgi:hypothetical protein